jgi:hypothetical protein
VTDRTDDAGVTQLPEDARLALEPLFIAGRLAAEDFDRDRLAAEAVARFVDGPHAAFAREPLDFELVRDQGSGLHTKKDYRKALPAQAS